MKVTIAIVIFTVLVIAYKWTSIQSVWDRAIGSNLNKTSAYKSSNTEAPKKTSNFRIAENEIIDNTSDSLVSDYNSGEKVNDQADSFNKNKVDDLSQSITFFSLPANDEKLNEDESPPVNGGIYDSGQSIRYGPVPVDYPVYEETGEIIGQPYDSGQSISFGPSGQSHSLIDH